MMRLPFGPIITITMIPHKAPLAPPFSPSRWSLLTRTGGIQRSGQTVSRDVIAMLLEGDPRPHPPTGPE